MADDQNPLRQTDEDGSAPGDFGPDDLEADNDDEEARGGRDGRVTEGEVRAAAAAASVASLPGHADTLNLYLQTDEGRHFVEVEAKERNTAAKAEVKEIQKQQKQSERAYKEYERRVAAEAEQTRAVRDAAQEAVEDKAEDDKAKSTSDRTPQSAARKGSPKAAAR